jgi:hypothetical protein
MDLARCHRGSRSSPPLPQWMPSSGPTRKPERLDSSGNQVSLGTVTQSSGGVWTLTSANAFGLTLGTYTLYAQAQDSYGVFGDPVALSLQVQ